MLTTACYSAAEFGLGLQLALDLVPGWLLAMNTYLYHLPLSLYRSRISTGYIMYVVVTDLDRFFAMNIKRSEVSK